MQKLTLSALVRNRSGVLLRVVGLYARRGFNITSLTVSETENPKFSRMTVVSEADEQEFIQIKKQLTKLEDVERVVILNSEEQTASELLLIKVHCLNKDRGQVLKTITAYGARVKNIGHKTITAELTGETKQVDSFINDMSVHKIAELSRSGITALEAGDTVLERKQENEGT